MKIWRGRITWPCLTPEQTEVQFLGHMELKSAQNRHSNDLLIFSYTHIHIYIFLYMRHYILYDDFDRNNIVFIGHYRPPLNVLSHVAILTPLNVLSHVAILTPLKVLCVLISRVKVYVRAAGREKSVLNSGAFERLHCMICMYNRKCRD